MRQFEAMFANFIVKFGERNMVDYLNEVVVPAFKDQELVRRYGDSTYSLVDVRLANLDESRGEPALFGRFVRDTKLIRTQIFVKKHGLVHDERAMQTSPSSFFVLTLADHRLLYYGETPFSPDIATFRATMAKFIKIKYDKYIDDLYTGSRGSANSRRVTKVSLYNQHKSPTVEIVPITNE